MDIISFFRSIDGWLYYTILVVNTILIFAIIGYIGEKSNEQMIKLGMNTKTPDLKNGAMNLTPTTAPSSSVSTNISIPKVAPTTINKEQPKASLNRTQVANGQNIATPPVNTNMSQNNLQSSAIPINNNGTAIPNTNGSIPLQNFNNDSRPIIKPEDNNVDPNEKAPAVLIINSPVDSKDMK